MCLTVYIASDAALALVPYLDADPRFNVRPLEHYDMAARKTIAANNVVSAGAHTGCGCGFMPEEDEPAEVIASRTALQHYLKEVLERGPIDLFVCWNGDEPNEWSEPLLLHINELVEREEWLTEGTRTRLVR